MVEDGQAGEAAIQVEAEAEDHRSKSTDERTLRSPCST